MVVIRQLRFGRAAKRKVAKIRDLSRRVRAGGPVDRGDRTRSARRPRAGRRGGRARSAATSVGPRGRADLQQAHVVAARDEGARQRTRLREGAGRAASAPCAARRAGRAPGRPRPRRPPLERPATRNAPLTRLAFQVALRSRGPEEDARRGRRRGGEVAVAGAERPPPLGRVNTVTGALPGGPRRRRSGARSGGVGDTKVVGRSAPFHRTTDRNAKPRPSTVRVAPGAPATRACGRPVMTGTAPIGCQSGEKSSVRASPPASRGPPPPEGRRDAGAGLVAAGAVEEIRAPVGGPHRPGRRVAGLIRVPPVPSAFTTSRSMSVRRTTMRRAVGGEVRLGASRGSGPVPPPSPRRSTAAGGAVLEDDAGAVGRPDRQVLVPVPPATTSRDPACRRG